MRFVTVAERQHQTPNLVPRSFRCSALPLFLSLSLSLPLRSSVPAFPHADTRPCALFALACSSLRVHTFHAYADVTRVMMQSVMSPRCRTQLATQQAVAHSNLRYSVFSYLSSLHPRGVVPVVLELLHANHRVDIAFARPCITADEEPLFVTARSSFRSY